LNIGNTIYGNTSTGKVGIGTATPAEKLDVNGNLLVEEVVVVANGSSLNKNVRFVVVTGDGGANTVQVYWNSNFGTSSGVIGAWDRSGNWASPTTSITSSNAWSIYGFIYEGA
jgi:hypothetical protein